MTSTSPNANRPDLDYWFYSERQLQILYPRSIQLLADKHWTPLRVTHLAVQFLASQKGARVLDIGSGVGKFCLAGAYLKPDAVFYGVEQRKHLVAHAEKARVILGLKNVRFYHRNLLQMDLSHFDHFYFFNSFYENLAYTDKIDNTVPCNPDLYELYHDVLLRKLKVMPTGTRLATFHCLEGMASAGYQLMEEHFGLLLRFWIKK